MSFHRPLAAATCAIVALAASGAPVAAQEGDSATLMQAGGSVRAYTTGWTALRPGALVHAGDTVKTMPESYADFVMSGGTRLTFGESTTVRFIELDGMTPTVRVGRVRVVAPPEGNINLMAGTLRISGGDADGVIERAGSGGWRVSVLSGTFRISDAGKNPQLLEAGRSAIFVTGGQDPRFSVITRSAYQDLVAGFAPEASATPDGPAPRAAGAPDPWVAAGLSALLPGAGQLYAGEVPRGLLYLGAEFALLGTGGYGVFTGQRQLAMYAGLGLLGLNLLSPVDAAFSVGAGPSEPGRASVEHPDRAVVGLAP
ncbi:MAG: hypothetical protein VKQ33_03420 [Candidatus Sericytochromatia bacterium]|nr:hypothetical protein [Candidatus Sericytochromatia bacterium]